VKKREEASSKSKNKQQEARGKKQARRSKRQNKDADGRGKQAPEGGKHERKKTSCSWRLQAAGCQSWFSRGFRQQR
jgi:hypothetical protein